LQKQKGVFQHSSFLAGGATSAAGRLVVEDGILKVWHRNLYCGIHSSQHHFFFPAQVRDVFISGCVASQWALPADRAELSGVHELPEGEECGSYQCDGKKPNIL
jgi:hypothetical protein